MTFFCYDRFVGGSIGNGKLFMIRTMVFSWIINISSIISFFLQVVFIHNWNPLFTPNMASVKHIYVYVHAEPSRFRLTHETSFVRGHSNFWTKTPILFYFVRIIDRCCNYIIFFFFSTNTNVNMMVF